jgi:hypothetical protein
MDGAVFQWGFGICATGFFFLAGWCWYLNSKMSAVLDVKEKVNEIHRALMGDFKEEGLVSRQRRMEKECSIRHLGSALCFLVGTLLLIASMASAYVVGDSCKFVYNLTSSTGAHVTGQTVALSIQKGSTGAWYDFSDGTFKSSGWTSKTSNLTEDTTNGFYYKVFTPPATETIGEQYLFCVVNENVTYADHQCTSVKYENPGADTVTVARIDKNTNGLKDVDNDYSGVEKMIQTRR